MNREKESERSPEAKAENETLLKDLREAYCRVRAQDSAFSHRRTLLKIERKMRDEQKKKKPSA